MKNIQPSQIHSELILNLTTFSHEVEFQLKPQLSHTDLSKHVVKPQTLKAKKNTLKPQNQPLWATCPNNGAT